MIDSNQRNVAENSRVRDLVIVGAGPAGISAAAEALNDGLDTLCIEAAAGAGGQLRLASRIDDVYLDLMDGVQAGSGKDVADQYHRIAQRRIGLNLRLGTRVTKLDFDPDYHIKTLHLSDGDAVQARSVILAVGLEVVPFHFSGSDAKNIIHGDAARLVDLAKDKFVAIFADAGYEWAAEAALEAARSAKHVHLLYQPRNRGRFPDAAAWADPRITVHGPDAIERVQTDRQGNAVSVLTKGGKTIASDMIGVFAKGQPNTDWLPPEISRIAGRIVTDQSETIEPPKGDYAVGLPPEKIGVFAAGDITYDTFALELLLQAKTQGVYAANRAYKYLRGESLEKSWVD